MDTTTLIAEQNDAFRKSIMQMATSPHLPQGKVVKTRGIADQSPDFQLALTRAVVSFSDFTQDADPEGEHEMGVVDIEGETVWFKIDLYNVNYEMGSPQPDDLKQTRRVLTMLFPSEY